VGDLLPHNKPPSFTERSPTYNSYWHGSRSLHCLIPHGNNISGRSGYRSIIAWCGVSQSRSPPTQQASILHRA
ncbi:hypothetical protein J6590_102794, partial [Homalodisca vitripennis]